jgi:tetratricopeptide (TPR) repeat protein
MEVTNLLTVITLLSLVAGLGLGIMVWAYQGSGSISVLFTEVMPVPDGLSAIGQQWFQAGVTAYIRGQYRRARDRFTQVAAQHPTCAAAIHNLGLTYANLRQDDQATKHLLRAVELYLQNDAPNFADPDSAALIKQQLRKLRSRKLARDEAN